ADGGTGTSPHAAARRTPVADFLRREIKRVSVIRIAAAALRGVGVDHAFVEVERPGFAVRRNELDWRGEVFAIRRIDLVQASIPGDRVDRVLAGRDLIDRGDRGLAAGAQRILSRRRTLVVGLIVLVPEER